MVGYAFMGAVHSQAWRTAGRFFDLPCAPAMTALCGRDAGGHGGCGRADGLGIGGDRLAATCSPGTTSSWSTSALRATPTPRSRSRRWRPASTCCARSRWPTRWPRPRRWSRRPRRPRREASDRWWRSTTAGCRPSRSPAGWSQDGRVGTIRHVRAQYLQDWIVDPSFPLVWRLQKDTRRARVRSGTSARTSSTWRSTSSEPPITGVTGLTETFIRERPLPEASSGLAASGGAGTGEVTVDDAALFLARFDVRGARLVRGHPVRVRPQERDAAGDQRHRTAASRSTSRR